MEERYWLRHPSLHGLLGPYTIVELQTGLAANTFPEDSYVLPDGGQDETALRASPHWRPITDALNLPRPPSPPDLPPAPPTPTELAEGRRGELRRRTAYWLPRTLISTGALIGIVVACLTSISAFAVIGRDNGFVSVTVLLGGLAWQILVIVVAAGALQALFDLADCALNGPPGAGGPEGRHPPLPGSAQP
jgi:hypothetical protein